MSTGRHQWRPEVSTAKWRKLDKCTKCGLRRWFVRFENRAHQPRQTYLYSTGHDPWTFGTTACFAAPAPGEGKG